MNSSLFFDNFSMVADSPNGIQNLREMILQLAVMGKLVPQDPNEHNASVLVEQIIAERKQLIKSKKVKEDKKLTDIKDDEIPKDLPTGWTVERFGKIIYVIRGASPRPKGDPRYFSTERTPYHWIKISDIRKYADGWILKDTDEFLTEEGAKKSVYLEKGTFILSNSATIGVPTILGINGCIHDGYLAFPYLNEKHILIKYLYYFFLYFQGELKKRAFGGAQLNLNTGIVKNIALPLPPHEEQKRIVTKVDQLMTMCDELETLQQYKSESRVHLNNAALNGLLNAGSEDEFDELWQLIQDNFDLLYGNLDNVAKLKEAILQLAVMGKLTPQDPNDEPAEVLLEKIVSEKKSLVKDGIIKKTKSLPSVQDDEISYELPDSWYWTRLGNIGIINPRNNVSDELDVSFVPMTLISEKYGYDADSETRPWKDIKKGYTHFAENDVVMAKITPCFQNGKSTVMKGLCNGIGAGTTELHVFRSVTEYVYPDYVLLYLKSPQFIETGINKMTGSAGQKRVPTDYFSQNPFPLPPLEEQKRIVAKVGKLMALCDELETRISKSQEKSERLTNAVVNSVVV